MLAGIFPVYTGILTGISPVCTEVFFLLVFHGYFTDISLVFPPMFTGILHGIHWYSHRYSLVFFQNIFVARENDTKYSKPHNDICFDDSYDRYVSMTGVSVTNTVDDEGD